ncbi:MAG: pyridoxamine 5'-phosphate oxidase family protein [Rudaea sp.]
MEDEEWIREMLRRSAVGQLAMAAGEQPYLNTNLFVLDEAAGVIYLHTANEGRTASSIERNANICFSVSEMGRLLPGQSAAEMSVEYASVLVFGRAERITDTEQAAQALRLLIAKYFPHLRYGEDYSGIQPADLQRTAVYRIQIEQWSGKRKKARADFPGAFLYGPARESQA